MRMSRTAATIVGLTLMSAFLPPASASAAATPAASVAINPQAFEGQRHTIIGGLLARCAPGFKFNRLVIDLSQDVPSAPNGVFTTTLAGKFVKCDGLWHKQQFGTSEEGWITGPAKVTARLRVTDVYTGKPKEGVQTKQIYVRPGAKIELPGTAVLTADGIKLVIRARCDKPWVLGEFGLEATQGEFPQLASDDFLSGAFPTCDGAFHSLTLWLDSSPMAFKRGWITVDAYIHTEDPVDFDPAPSALARRAVKVN